MSANNVITITFGVNRSKKTEKEQFALLMQRVIDEIYKGRWAEMLTDYHYDQVTSFDGSFKQWLQEKLGAVAVSSPCR